MDDPVSNPDMSEIFSSLKRADCLWGQHSFLFNGHRSSFPEVDRQAYELTIRLRPVQKLRMSGAVFICRPPPYIDSWRAEG